MTTNEVPFPCCCGRAPSSWSNAFEFPPNRLGIGPIKWLNIHHRLLNIMDVDYISCISQYLSLWLCWLTNSLCSFRRFIRQRIHCLDWCLVWCMVWRFRVSQTSNKWRKNSSRLFLNNEVGIAYGVIYEQTRYSFYRKFHRSKWSLEIEITKPCHKSMASTISHSSNLRASEIIS